jgi:hypothetical protein
VDGIAPRFRCRKYGAVKAGGKEHGGRQGTNITGVCTP